MIIRLGIVFSGVLLLAGCATKQYPIAASLSPSVTAKMTCRELDLEIAKGEDIQRQITKTGQFDTKSVLGILGDFGIGNNMAESEARQALANRLTVIREAKARKGC